MTTDPKASGGSTQSPGGTPENNPNNTTERPDVVKYDTYQKVLSEKKRKDEELAETRKRLDELTFKEKERDEQQLKEKEDYKKLLEIRDKELADSKTRYSNLHGTLEQGVKRGAFLDALSGSVDEQYYSLIDLKDVLIDPATGMPDESSVLKAAREFETKYPLVIKKSTGNGLPNDAARGGATKLTYDEWKKLPLKEQKARLAEVV